MAPHEIVRDVLFERITDLCVQQLNDRSTPVPDTITGTLQALAIALAWYHRVAASGYGVTTLATPDNSPLTIAAALPLADSILCQLARRPHG